MAELQLEQLTKVYGDGTKAVSELDLDVADGELVVFVGPSGCGKTSALRMIAGLEQISGGTVRVGGEIVNDLPPKARDVAMVFQNYALYPHMNVYDNIGFGLKMRGFDRAEVRKRVEGAARVLGLTDMLTKRPRHLSGGQRQRVAMGRAIVRQPQVFLMDEPLSNLDAKLRVQMRAEISRIQRDLAVTTIYVTHDQSEAMTLGDRVCVLRGGFLQQVDRPQMLYARPANLFVAEFIGSPAMNLGVARLFEREGRWAVSFGRHELPVGDDILWARPDLKGYAGRTIGLGIRPEDLEDARLAPSTSADQRLAVHVDIKEDMGSDAYLHFTVDAPMPDAAELREAVGDEALEAADEQTHHHGAPWIARVGRTSLAREGEPVELAVSTQHLHFFDLDTGEGIYGRDEVEAAEPARPAAAV
ncbi:MAG TPA: sn-glycerol-3-phosphate ABC transporter ATP-binding protein UgpC [Gaiellaceae bacterium]|nr:sn-glycerol-3-phosphate ABC transporter ATP-binding protein UgpC [Gaiellaceae bacterium]